MHTRPTGLALMTGLALLTSCATAERFTGKPMVQRDAHTSYAVDDATTGFVLYVYYSRFQFFPESAAVDQAATSQLLSLAHEIAGQLGKPIEPINEQQIRKSMGRNIFTGITSWSGMVPATFTKVDEAPTGRLDPPQARSSAAPPNKLQMPNGAPSGAGN